LGIHLRGALRWLAISTFVLGAAGSATAQQAAGRAPDVTVGFEQRPKLSPQEELTQADTILARVDGAAATVRRQLEAARQARDVVKTLCLNDKLSQIDVTNRSARDRQAALQAAVQRNDVELSNHEFAILTVLRQRAEQLIAEANQCIGEEMAFIGQTSIITTIDPNQLPPGEDPAGYPETDPTLVSGPPYCISCTR
jgi:hypothetical protein